MPKSFFLTYWKTITLCVIIFVLSSVTFSTIPKAARFENSDKVVHVLMYVVLGFVASYEYLKDNFFKLKYRYWFVYLFLFLVFFGGLIEILQGTLFQPRTSEVMDWGADIIGLILGFGVGRWFWNKF